MLNVRINLNGDTATYLKDQLQYAPPAGDNALSAVNSLTIHWRNYQTLEVGHRPCKDGDEDADAVLGHIVALHELQAWLTECWLALDEQSPKAGD